MNGIINGAHAMALEAVLGTSVVACPQTVTRRDRSWLDACTHVAHRDGAHPALPAPAAAAALAAERFPVHSHRLRR